MRLMSSTDFALRILMYLAKDPDRKVRTEDLSQALGISHNHVQKIVQALAAGDFIRTVRGAKGGIALKRPPAQISVGEVVRKFEGEQPIVECFRADGGHCVLSPCCALKDALFDAQEAFYTHLDRFTVADSKRPPSVKRQ